MADMVYYTWFGHDRPAATTEGVGLCFIKLVDRISSKKIGEKCLMC